MKNVSYMRALRVELRRLGLCLVCGKADATIGTRCARCRENDRARMHRKREEARAAGMCRMCYRRPSTTARCERCRGVLAAANRRRYWAARRCPTCGYSFDDKTKTCPKCAAELGAK